MHAGEPQISIGVGAAVFRGDEILIVRRGKPPFCGQWSIPGGRPRYGESLKVAAAREVKEETGIEMRIGGLIGVFETPPPAAGEDHFVLIDYWAEWLAGEPRAGDDALEAAFVPVAEALRRVGWDETRRAIEGAVKLRNTVKDTP